MSDQERGCTLERGPFGLPITKNQWYGALIGGLVAGFLIMGLVYELTKASFIGPISVAEALGWSLMAVYSIGVIGPLSPFRLNNEGKDA